ncbi:HS12A-like protein [Mya arenaria]|uniref:HS12A-like protein n=1 Tax=Mya arenaria TaxID=6604 RepID=A0ABY7GBU5_MYAAR|nr:HS12A-like protein [Mya arenaria]
MSKRILSKQRGQPYLAGIASDRVQLALEPEVASIWCQTSKTPPGSGTRNMVVDLGGGTADISIHERLEDGSLKEIHRASGGPWGGMNPPELGFPQDV